MPGLQILSYQQDGVTLKPEQVSLAKLYHGRSETWPLYTVFEQVFYFCTDKGFTVPTFSIRGGGADFGKILAYS